MSKKSLFVILMLGIVLTYVSSILDAIFNETLLGGKSGFPFKYSSSTLFGGGSIDYGLMLLNIVFWFVVVWITWKLFYKVFKK